MTDSHTPVRKRRIHWPTITIAALSLIIMLRMLATNDIVVLREPLGWGFLSWAHRIPVLLDHFREVFLHGTLYPRWLPDLMGGNGYPTFLFYQPGIFFFVLPFALVISDIVLATKIALLALLLLAGGGAYKLSRLFTSRIGATAAAALYLLNPYLLANLYLRGAHAELLGMILCPWCGYYAFRLYREWRENRAHSKTATGFMLSLAALGISHPFVSLHFAPILMLLLLGMWIDAGRNAWKLMAVFALCGLGAAILASPYLLVVLQLRDEINFQGIQFTFLTWLQPLGNILAANPLSTALACLGLWSKRRAAVTWAIIIGWGWLIFIQTEGARTLWEQFEPLRLIQLPYRALSTDAFLRLIACAFAFSFIESRLRGSVRMKLAVQSAVVATCLAAMIWNPMAIPATRTPFSVSELTSRLQDESHTAFKAAMTKRYDDQSLHHDFIPRRVNLERLEKEPPFSRPMVWAEQNVPVTMQNLEGYPPYDIRFRVTIPDSPELRANPASLHIRQFYFTGWRVRVNEEAQASGTLSADGAGQAWGWGVGDDARIQINFYQPGEYLVEADYEGPPYWLLRNILILLLTVAIISANRRLLAR